MRKYTYKELIEDYKLTDMDLAYLIDDGFIEKGSNQTYIFSVEMEKLKIHATKLIMDNEYVDGNIYLNIYYKLGKESRNITLNHLFNKVKNKQFEGIYDILDNLKKCSCEDEMHIYNAYLYLISFIVDCPYELDDYLEMPKSLNFYGMTTSGEKTCEYIREGQYISAYTTANLNGGFCI